MSAARRCSGVSACATSPLVTVPSPAHGCAAAPRECQPRRACTRPRTTCHAQASTQQQGGSGDAPATPRARTHTHTHTQTHTRRHRPPPHPPARTQRASLQSRRVSPLHRLAVGVYAGKLCRRHAARERLPARNKKSRGIKNACPQLGQQTPPEGVPGGSGGGGLWCGATARPCGAPHGLYWCIRNSLPGHSLRFLLRLLAVPLRRRLRRRRLWVAVRLAVPLCTGHRSGVGCGGAAAADKRLVGVVAGALKARALRELALGQVRPHLQVAPSHTQAHKHTQAHTHKHKHTRTRTRTHNTPHTHHHRGAARKQVG